MFVIKSECGWNKIIENQISSYFKQSTLCTKELKTSVIEFTLSLWLGILKKTGIIW